MTHEFCLVLTASAVTDEQVKALYEAGLDDGTISSSEGITRIDIGRSTDSLESAIRSAIGQVNASAGVRSLKISRNFRSWLSRKKRTVAVRLGPSPDSAMIVPAPYCGCSTAIPWRNTFGEIRGFSCFASSSAAVVSPLVSAGVF